MGRKIFAFQQSQLFFDATKYSLNAAGSFLAYDSLHARDRRYNGRAGVCWNISGAVYMFGPIISRVLAKEVGEGHKRACARQLAMLTKRPFKSWKQTDNCSQICAAAPRLHQTKSQLLSTEARCTNNVKKAFSDEIISGQKAKAKATTVASQNIGAGLYLGASRLSQGILFTIPGFNRAYNSKTERANKVTNTDLFAAAVIGIPASAFAMLDTLRIQVQGELNRHKLKKSGLLPSQIAKCSTQATR